MTLPTTYWCPNKECKKCYNRAKSFDPYMTSEIGNGIKILREKVDIVCGTCRRELRPYAYEGFNGMMCPSDNCDIRGILKVTKDEQ